MGLQDKNVVYVGGFGGIGFATCKVLLSKGIANLVVLDMAENVTLYKELCDVNPKARVYFLQYDVTEGIDTARNILANVLKKVNSFDILVNGAGVYDETNISKVIDVNLKGLITTTTAAIEIWDKRNGGKGGLVVNIGSIAGLMRLKECPIYSATKIGVQQFTQCASQLKDITGVSLLTICPGRTETPMLSIVNMYLNAVENKLSNIVSQSAPAFAEKCVQVIEEAKNGSISTIIGGELNYIEVPPFMPVPKEII